MNIVLSELLKFNERKLSSTSRRIQPENEKCTDYPKEHSRHSPVARARMRIGDQSLKSARFITDFDLQRALEQ